MLPWAVNTFKLEEIATVNSLRRQVNDMFKKYAHMKDPKARCGCCSATWLALTCFA